MMFDLCNQMKEVDKVDHCMETSIAELVVFSFYSDNLKGLKCGPQYETFLLQIYDLNLGMFLRATQWLQKT